MKKFLGKYNLELLTVIMLAMVAITAVRLPDVSIVRRILAVYMVLFTLHEWEETRYPGGFSAMMQKLMGVQFDADAEKQSHIPVFVLLLTILIIPYLLDSVIVLALIPVFLGLFECFVHVVGIKVHKTKRPYTPGMVTALCMLIVSVYAIYYYAAHDLAGGKDFLLGAICMVASFAVMQNRVLAICGVGYRDMAAAMKRRLKQHSNAG